MFWVYWHHTQGAPGQINACEKRLSDWNSLSLSPTLHINENNDSVQHQQISCWCFLSANSPWCHLELKTHLIKERVELDLNGLGFVCSKDPTNVKFLESWAKTKTTHCHGCCTTVSTLKKGTNPAEPGGLCMTHIYIEELSDKMCSSCESCVFRSWAVLTELRRWT